MAFIVLEKHLSTIKEYPLLVPDRIFPGNQQTAALINHNRRTTSIITIIQCSIAIHLQLTAAIYHHLSASRHGTRMTNLIYLRSPIRTGNDQTRISRHFICRVIIP